MKRKNWQRIALALMCVFFCSFSITFIISDYHEKTANAANLELFNPGNIISDYVMTNYDSMTEEEIQAFLTAKNPCNNRNYQDYVYQTNTYGPKYSWHWEDDHFVCLSEENFETERIVFCNKGPLPVIYPTEEECINPEWYYGIQYTGEVEEVVTINAGKAASIIYQIAQHFKINPQVLMVVLQKEQTLITDTWPNSVQYKTATGYGCPDTAPCDSTYFGFVRQVALTAHLFRNIQLGTWGTKYIVGDWNEILFNPDRACGAGSVYMENAATASLYRYTPYQPNAAALAAGYGSGDYCSAYGNRNFYHYFVDWFGDPTSEGITNQDFSYGSYNIISTLNTELNLANNNGSLVNGQELQNWILDRAQSGNYYIINEKNMQYLTRTEDNQLILTSEKTESINQEWIIAINSMNKKYIIYTPANNDAVDVSNAAIADGTPIALYKRWTILNSAQEWDIIPAKQEDISGLYMIKTATDLSKAIDIENGATEEESNVQIFINWLGNKAQEWSIEKVEGEDVFIMRNPTANKAIDVSWGELNDGQNIWIYFINYTCAQKWKFQKNVDGTFIIQNACDANAVISREGDNVKIKRTTYFGNNQKWQLVKIDEKNENEQVSNPEETPEQEPEIEPEPEPEEPEIIEEGLTNGIYSIHPLLNPSMALDIENGNYYLDMTNVQIFTFWQGNIAQEWELIKHTDTGEEYYTIKSAYSDKAIDVSWGELKNNQNIWIYDTNNTCAQRWNIEKQTNGTYIIRNSCDKTKVLDVENYYTNIQLYEDWGIDNIAQRWIINKIR